MKKYIYEYIDNGEKITTSFLAASNDDANDIAIRAKMTLIGEETKIIQDLIAYISCGYRQELQNYLNSLDE